MYFFRTLKKALFLAYFAVGVLWREPQPTLLNTICCDHNYNPYNNFIHPCQKFALSIEQGCAAVGLEPPVRHVMYKVGNEKFYFRKELPKAEPVTDMGVETLTTEEINTLLLGVLLFWLSLLTAAIWDVPTKGEQGAPLVAATEEVADRVAEVETIAQQAAAEVRAEAGINAAAAVQMQMPPAVPVPIIAPDDPVNIDAQEGAEAVGAGNADTAAHDQMVGNNVANPNQHVIVVQDDDVRDSTPKDDKVSGGIAEEKQDTPQAEAHQDVSVHSDDSKVADTTVDSTTEDKDRAEVRDTRTDQPSSPGTLAANQAAVDYWNTDLESTQPLQADDDNAGVQSHDIEKSNEAVSYDKLTNSRGEHKVEETEAPTQPSTPATLPEPIFGQDNSHAAVAAKPRHQHKNWFTGIVDNIVKQKQQGSKQQVRSSQSHDAQNVALVKQPKKQEQQKNNVQKWMDGLLNPQGRRDSAQQKAKGSKLAVESHKIEGESDADTDAPVKDDAEGFTMVDKPAEEKEDKTGAEVISAQDEALVDEITKKTDASLTPTAVEEDKKLSEVDLADQNEGAEERKAEDVISVDAPVEADEDTNTPEDNSSIDQEAKKESVGGVTELHTTVKDSKEKTTYEEHSAHDEEAKKEAVDDVPKVDTTLEDSEEKTTSEETSAQDEEAKKESVDNVPKVDTRVEDIEEKTTSEEQSPAQDKVTVEETKEAAEVDDKVETTEDKSATESKAVNDEGIVKESSEHIDEADIRFTVTEEPKAIQHNVDDNQVAKDVNEANSQVAIKGSTEVNKEVDKSVQEHEKQTTGDATDSNDETTVDKSAEKSVEVDASSAEKEDTKVADVVAAHDEAEVKATDEEKSKADATGDSQENEKEAVTKVDAIQQDEAAVEKTAFTEADADSTSEKVAQDSKSTVLNTVQEVQAQPAISEVMADQKSGAEAIKAIVKGAEKSKPEEQPVRQSSTNKDSEEIQAQDVAVTEMAPLPVTPKSPGRRLSIKERADFFQKPAADAGSVKPTPPKKLSPPRLAAHARGRTRMRQDVGEREQEMPKSSKSPSEKILNETTGKKDVILPPFEPLDIPKRSLLPPQTRVVSKEADLSQSVSPKTPVGSPEKKLGSPRNRVDHVPPHKSPSSPQSNRAKSPPAQETSAAKQNAPSPKPSRKRQRTVMSLARKEITCGFLSEDSVLGGIHTIPAVVLPRDVDGDIVYLTGTVALNARAPAADLCYPLSAMDANFDYEHVRALLENILCEDAFREIQIALPDKAAKVDQEKPKPIKIIKPMILIVEEDVTGKLGGRVKELLRDLGAKRVELVDARKLVGQYMPYVAQTQFTDAAIVWLGVDGSRSYPYENGALKYTNMSKESPVGGTMIAEFLDKIWYPQHHRCMLSKYPAARRMTYALMYLALRKDDDKTTERDEQASDEEERRPATFTIDGQEITVREEHNRALAQLLFKPVNKLMDVIQHSGNPKEDNLPRNLRHVLIFDDMGFPTKLRGLESSIQAKIYRETGFEPTVEVIASFETDDEGRTPLMRCAELYAQSRLYDLRSA